MESDCDCWDWDQGRQRRQNEEAMSISIFYSPQSSYPYWDRNRDLTQPPMNQIGARSPANQIGVQVIFLNVTSRVVDVLWVNFTGEEVSYGVLQPNESIDINTFANHPWIFRDHVTDSLFLADGQPVFNPVPCNGRKLVRISYSLLRLSEITIQAVKSATKDQGPLRLMYRSEMDVSFETTENVEVVFRNMTNHEVSLIWLNSDGHQMLYWVILKYDLVAVKTYVSHMWLAETIRGERLLIDGKQCYSVRQKKQGEQRIILYIERPFYSLLELARKQLRETIYCTTSPVKLHLPPCVQKDIDRHMPILQ